MSVFDPERIARITALANDGMDSAYMEVNCAVSSRGVVWSLTGGRVTSSRWHMSLEDALVEAEEMCGV